MRVVSPRLLGGALGSATSIAAGLVREYPGPVVDTVLIAHCDISGVIDAISKCVTLRTCSVRASLCTVSGTGLAAFTPGPASHVATAFNRLEATMKDGNGNILIDTRPEDVELKIVDESGRVVGETVQRVLASPGVVAVTYLVSDVSVAKARVCVSVHGLEVATSDAVRKVGTYPHAL